MKFPLSSARGFTLLEVMVALAILALALMAALRAGAVATQNTGEIRQRQLADWVALDRLEEHRARRDWLPVGISSGETMQGNQRFRWEEKIGGTPNAQFRRVEIRVLADDSTDPNFALARVTGFLIKPGG
ncbi:MAG: type II secretion system minor pseudopilin GspI [Proteobacteria bacterium]|nr:type II secretion system minor pseudopilin GspI [Pseudomonadota bacterium]